MRWNLTCGIALAAGLLAGHPSAAAAPASSVEVDSSTFGGLTPRAIGPAWGRIADLVAVPDSPLTIYVGAADGGIWRSRDGGTTWSPVFDDHTQSIGALAIDPEQSKTIWAGTGESWTRNSTSIGDGVYRSTDGGDNWEHLGLEQSERIARIAVDPHDSKTVWVCATGKLWAAGEERGVFKTTDAGKSWKKVLYVDPNTGCSDLAVDPQDAQILYAGMWQFRRYPWAFRSGGPGSGLYKSTDGGQTWRQLKQGLPAGDKGRIALAIAPSRPNVVYTLVESKKTALYRSDDTGENWTEVNSGFNLQVRPFYFARLVVDPGDFNYVYKPGLTLTISTDGGHTFSAFLGGGHFNGPSFHSDLHALWINPKNPQQMLLGTDGGVYTSDDRAHSWRMNRSLPVGQFYEIAYDMQQPYHVYGGLQDNGSWTAPSRGIDAIGPADWRNIGGGDGFWAFPDPGDPGIIYSEYQGGHANRILLATGESKEIRPLPGPGEPEYRFSWNTPFCPSPSQPKTIYMGAQFLFRSHDRGDTWERISPDLTTNDPLKQKQLENGGLTIDNSSAEIYTTLSTIAESPKDPQTIWVGTDDGNVQLTRDGGKTWKNVGKAVAGLPPGTWVSRIEPSHYDAGTAYATFDNHHNGDMKTYAYKTTDFGATWMPLAGTLTAGYAHVIREDLENRNLLFLGTELGLYISIDGGGRWARFTAHFPSVAVRDVAIHPREGDLLIATHGRGIYILDDITPLRKLTPEVLDSEVAFLPSRPATAVIPAGVQDFPGDDQYFGDNPEDSAVINYYLKKRHVVGEMRLEIYDEKGELISTLPASKRRGINRVAWPMRLAPPKMPGGNSVIESGGSFIGPRVADGTYTVKLIKDQQVYTSKVTIAPDPRASYSAEDRALQQKTARTLYGMLERLTYVDAATVAANDGVTTQVAGLGKGDKRAAQLKTLSGHLVALHQSLVATREGGWLSGEEQLREKLGGLYGAVNSYDGRPSGAQLEQAKVLTTRLEAAEAKLKDIAQREIAPANQSLGGKTGGPIAVPSFEEWKQKQGKGEKSSGSSMTTFRSGAVALPGGWWLDLAVNGDAVDDD